MIKSSFIAISACASLFGYSNLDVTVPQDANKESYDSVVAKFTIPKAQNSSTKRANITEYQMLLGKYFVDILNDEKLRHLCQDEQIQIEPTTTSTDTNKKPSSTSINAVSLGNARAKIDYSVKENLSIFVDTKIHETNYNNNKSTISTTQTDMSVTSGMSFRF